MSKYVSIYTGMTGILFIICCLPGFGLAADAQQQTEKNKMLLLTHDL